MLTKGWRVAGGGWWVEGGRWRVEGGRWWVAGGGQRGGQRLDLKMEADYDWSPEMRLHGCAGSLVADM